MLFRTALFARRGDRDAEALREALSDALVAWMTRDGQYVRVEPRDHADRHAEIGPMGPLPWVAPWLRFSCDGAFGDDALPLARWVSTRLRTDVVVVREHDDGIDDDGEEQSRHELLLFRDGLVLPDAEMPTLESLRLHVIHDTGVKLLAFRARAEIRFVSGPPALSDLRSVFVDEAHAIELVPHQFRRLRLTADSVGGESTGVRIHASGSALEARLLVAVKATWDSESALVSGSDDEAPFVTRDTGKGVVATLARARLRRARADGVRAWSWNDPSSGDLLGHSSSSVYTDVDLVAGSRIGGGVLSIRITPEGANEEGAVSRELRVVIRAEK